MPPYVYFGARFQERITYPSQGLPVLKFAAICITKHDCRRYVVATYVYLSQSPRGWLLLLVEACRRTNNVHAKER